MSQDNVWPLKIICNVCDNLVSDSFVSDSHVGGSYVSECHVSEILSAKRRP